MQRATDLGDTVKRIDGTEVPLLTPWLGGKTSAKPAGAAPEAAAPAAKAAKPAVKAAKPAAKAEAPAKAEGPGRAPETLTAPRGGKADDLKMIKGVGPKLEAELNALGIYTFAQIAAMTESDLIWLDEQISSVRGRPMRDDWVGQAKALAG